MTSVVESLTSAINASIVPDQEYFLQGSILDSSLELLIHRLRGLCDNVDSGLQTYNEHEMVFSIRVPTSGVATPMTGPILRVRRALEPELDPNTTPWQLRYVGNTEVGDKNRPTLVRSCIDVACSNNLVEFLTEMGFRREYELILKGYFFRKGRMKVTVSKICRIGAGKVMVPENIEPLSNSHLVELSIVTPKTQELVGDDMRTFAEQLKPLVQLDKVDARRLT